MLWRTLRVLPATSQKRHSEEFEGKKKHLIMAYAGYVLTDDDLLEYDDDDLSFNKNKNVLRALRTYSLRLY